MTKITKLYLKLLSLGLVLSLIGCSHYHHDQIDERYPFLGTYHAEETFYNAHTMTHESFQYDIDITESYGNNLEIIVRGYGNNGIYGTNCSLVAAVYNGSHIDIPLNICHYDNNTTYEIIGHGDLSSNGYHLTFDLDIVRCDGPNCHDEPKVHIDAHRI